MVQLNSDGESAGERRADDRLVTLAAESASRLGNICASWPADRVRDVAFQSALSRLKYEYDLEPAAFETIRRRFREHRAEFFARLEDRIE